MKYECDMIGDLLPLYKDKACSQASISIVEEHLAECPRCREQLDKLSDTAIDEMIVREKNEVIRSQSRYFRTKSALIGGIIAGIFAVPILICLIVDLASGNGLGWFFIVFTAMLIPTSLIVVPLIAPKNRLFQTLVGFTVSLLLLLGVCCIYSRGTWFLVAAPATLFGLTVCFMPFIACHEPVKEHLKDFKGLTVMGACTLTYIVMMLCIGLYVQTPGYFGTAFGISAPWVLMAWCMFAVIRYLPVNGLTRTGICIALIGIGSVITNELMQAIILRSAAMEGAGVTVYTTPSAIYAVAGIGIGAVLALIGLATGRKGGKEQ